MIMTMKTKWFLNEAYSLYIVSHVHLSGVHKTIVLSTKNKIKLKSKHNFESALMKLGKTH